MNKIENFRDGKEQKKKGNNKHIADYASLDSSSVKIVER